MPNQALEQTRDKVLRYGEVVGCELLNFFVRQQKPRAVKPRAVLACRQWLTMAAPFASRSQRPTLECRCADFRSAIKGKRMASACRCCHEELSFVRALDFDYCERCGLTVSSNANRGTSLSRGTALRDLCAEASATISINAAPAIPVTSRLSIKQKACATIVGFMAFLVCLSIGIGITIAMVRAQSAPRPETDALAFAEAMVQMSRFWLGAVGSFIVAAVVGLVAFCRIAFGPLPP